MTFSQVFPATLDAAWVQLEPMIQRGLRHAQGDGFTTEYLYGMIRAGHMALWVAHEDADIQMGLVLSITEHPTGKKIFIELIAGRNPELWSDHLERLLMDYRDLIGAICVEASCRPAMARLLSDRGWRKKAIVMEAPR